MAISKIEAIISLDSTAVVTVRGETVEWISGAIKEPTDAEIKAEQERLQTEYDNNKYQRDRAAEYPSVKDFMEAYTEKEIGSDSTKWDAYVVNYNKVRTDNPKG
jgi:hypothetical protein